MLDGAWLFFQPNTGRQIRIQTLATQHLRRQAPRVAMFGITNKCNLSCDFCSRDPSVDSAWTVQSAYAALRGLSEAGTLEVAFGGGEPFAFGGFAELIHALHDTTPLALNVTTNGTLLNARNIMQFAGRFGAVRVSVYAGSGWQKACALLTEHGQPWGANLIVEPQVLASMPALLAELAALGCGDVSLLSYIGPNPFKHLSPIARRELAAMIEDAPLPCRLSVCFGDQVPVPRLFDGMDGAGDCGAGLDFVSITPDQRVLACSFQEGGLPGATADEILSAWRDQQTQLALPSPRKGCARRSGRIPAPARTAPVAVWQGFSGNNSGECVMVAKFDAVADAQAYLSTLLPDWEPDGFFPEAWKQLLRDEGFVCAHNFVHSEAPNELVAIGRSVIALGYAADDMHHDLRGLAWKKGAQVLPGGVHVHDGLHLLAAVRATHAQDVSVLAQQLLQPPQAPQPPQPPTSTYWHGEVVLLVIPLNGPAPQSLANARDWLQAYAGPRALAAEVVAEPITPAAMTAVTKRLGNPSVAVHRLAVAFGGKETEADAARFAQLVSEGTVTVVGGCALVEGVQRRKRLAVLAHRMGGHVTALDEEKVCIHAYFTPPH